MSGGDSGQGDPVRVSDKKSRRSSLKVSLQTELVMWPESGMYTQEMERDPLLMGFENFTSLKNVLKGSYPQRR